MRYLTAGESHGKGLITILEGIPANLPISATDVNRDLARRQVGYGRGGRMEIEKDRVEIVSGIRQGRTIGSPIAMYIRNLDWENWKEVMAVEAGAEATPVTRPRPGHADLSGAIKYAQRDIRNILERSSARETAARVAVGAVCKRFLQEFGIKVMSWVIAIGGIRWDRRDGDSFEDLFNGAEASELRCPDRQCEGLMRSKIDEAGKRGDTLGGVFEVIVTGVPPGLGTHIQWDRKLDARLAMALMSIQAIKGVEVGLGFGVASRMGSEVHDEIFLREGPQAGPWKFYRETNRAGGIEGGMSNGEPIVLRAAMKPIPTLRRPLRSVDIVTKEPFEATRERSDICAVPAASVVGEAVVAFEIARAFLEKFGGDSMDEVRRNYDGYLRYLEEW